MDKQIHINIILVNLQNAFDTLEDGLLLEKMKYFGFRFEYYLSNRKFLVCTVFSEAGTLKYVVPQGSILGSLLFPLHVNDLLDHY